MNQAMYVANADELDVIEQVVGLPRSSCGGVWLRDGNGDEYALPDVLMRLLVDVAADLARGSAVEFRSYGAELLPTEAANLLHCSPARVVELVAEGQLGSVESSGRFDRVRLADVLAYRERLRSDQDLALTELVRLSEELGLYDVPERDQHVRAAS